MDRDKHIILPPYFTKKNIEKIKEAVPVHVERVLLLYSYLMYRNISRAERFDVSFKEHRPTTGLQVHSDYLKIIFGKSLYRTTVKLLALHGLLEIDESYMVSNGTSKGYSKSYKIPAKLLSKKYDRCLLHYELSNKHVITAKKKLLARIKLGKINTIKLADDPKQILLDSLDKLDVNTIPFEKHYYYSSGAKMDSFGWRLHSAITYMKKDNRKKLRYTESAESLVELDITTSQMYFFANLNHDLINKVLCADDAKKFKQIINELVKNPSFQLFKEHVLYSGTDVYSEFAKHFGWEREAAKKMFMKVFFGSKYANRSKEKEYFESRYPGLLEIIHQFQDAYIKDGSDFNKKNKRSGNLTKVLQRIESKMVLEEVVMAGAEQGITDILTIHDSWLVRKSQKEQFKQIAKETFNHAFGNAPEIDRDEKKDPQMIESPVCM